MTVAAPAETADKTAAKPEGDRPMVNSYYAADTGVVYGAGQNVAAQSGDAEAISVVVLEDLQSAADSVVHTDDGVTGLHAIGEKVRAALEDYGTWMQSLLGDLISEIIAVGDSTSASAVIVDEADLEAVESFQWDTDPGVPPVIEPPSGPTSTTTTSAG